MDDAERLPPIPREQMTPEQLAAAVELEAGPRGAVVGPFIAALRSPEFMRRLQSLGEYLRFDNALGPRLTELVVLLVARQWTQQFEWVMHAPLAADAGIARAAIDEIAEGRRPRELPEDEAIVYDFVSELARTQAVSDATFDRARTVLGEAGIVDLVGTVGYYASLAMIMSVARTPLPPDKSPALKPLSSSMPGPTPGSMPGSTPGTKPGSTP
jgi:4-carboxymuconolactone decarboxylase